MAITQQNVANAGGSYAVGVFKIPGTQTELQAVVLVDSSGTPVSSTGGGPIEDGVDSNIKATVKDYSNSNPLTTVLVDTNGDPYVASGSSGVQYTEGDVDASVTGTAVMWRTSGNVMTPVDSSNPLPTSIASLPLPSGASTSAKQDSQTALLTTIDADTSALAGCVSGTELQVDVVTMPAVTVTGVATAANQVLEQALLTDIVTYTSATSNHLGDVVQDDGSTAPTKGLQVGGIDGSGNFQRMSTDTSGRPNVNINGTVPVSGTVAATQSGTWNITNISGTVSLPTGAATLAEQQTQTASLSVLDDWDESDRAKVNIIVGNAGVTGNTGTVDAGTQRVCLATNVALPAGTNNIGDVDVLTLPALAAGTNTIGNVHLVPTPPNMLRASVQITGTTSQQVVAAPGSNVYLVLWSITIANFTATDQAQLLSGSTRFDFVRVLASTTIQLTYPRGCLLGNNEAFNFDSAASADWFVSCTYSTTT